MQYTTLLNLVLLIGIPLASAITGPGYHNDGDPCTEAEFDKVGCAEDQQSQVGCNANVLLGRGLSGFSYGAFAFCADKGQTCVCSADGEQCGCVSGLLDRSMTCG